MKAADIMMTEIVSIGPEMDVSEVAQILLAHGVSAAPVIDHGGRLCGIVSEGDLIRRAGCAGAGVGGSPSLRTKLPDSFVSMALGLVMS